MVEIVELFVVPSLTLRSAAHGHPDAVFVFAEGRTNSVSTVTTGSLALSTPTRSTEWRPIRKVGSVLY